MNKQNDSHDYKADSHWCRKRVTGNRISISGFSCTPMTASSYSQSIQPKAQTLFLSTKTFVKFNILFFLAICLMLSSCGRGGGSKPDVYVDAEEYTVDGVQAYTKAQWHTAQRLFNKALLLYQGIDDQRGALLSYINLAEVSLALHDYTASNKYLMYAEAIAKFSSLQHYRLRIILLYGQNALQQKQFTKAEHILQEVLPAFDDTTLLARPDTTQLAAIASLTKIAFLQSHDELLWTSRYANALQKIGNKNTDREARLLRFKSKLLLQQDADKEAESKNLQALALYKSTQSRKGIAVTLLELAQYYRSKQQWQVAQDYFNRSRSVYHFLREDDKVAMIKHILVQVQSHINQ